MINGIVQFLADNPRPKDEDVHAWAEENGHTPEEVEEYLYGFIHDLMHKLSKSVNEPDDKYDADQLARGIEVELEHTDNKDLAKMIAKDHLNECSGYYDMLDKAEPTCKDITASVQARLAIYSEKKK